MEKKWSEWLEQIKSHSKFPNKNQLLLIFLCGLLLLVIVWPVSDGREEPDSGTTEAGLSEGAKDPGKGRTEMDSGRQGAYTESVEAYEEYLEQRLSSALEYVEGVGRAEVVITLKSSGQRIVEKDQSSSSQASSEEDQNGGTRETQNRSSDKTSVYTQGSDGSQTPYISKELTPEIEGVLVIAEGGENAVVIQNITEAIQALFGVEAHKIKIMKRTDT